MSDFNIAYDLTIKNEGGYVNDPSDRGGETYKGVARNMHSAWRGWATIDLLKKQSSFPSNLEKDLTLQNEIKEFYKINFWDKLRLSEVKNQNIANNIFDFGVNAGTSTSAVLVQKVLDTEADGVIGDKTINILNHQQEEEKFIALFTIAKILRYIHICNKRPLNKKYFFGWVIRAIGH